MSMHATRTHKHACVFVPLLALCLPTSDNKPKLIHHSPSFAHLFSNLNATPNPHQLHLKLNVAAPKHLACGSTRHGSQAC